MVTQETLLAAVHGQPASELTVTAPVPPVDPRLAELGEME
jgi:hypothetical protein